MKNYRLLFFILVMVLIILNVIKNIYVFNYKYQSEKVENRKNCIVIRMEKISDEKVSYLVKYNSNQFILNIYVDKYQDKNDILDLSKFGNYTYGDILTFRGKITIPQNLNNPYEFDYKRYLNSNNIVGTITTYKTQKVNKKICNPLLYIGYFLREKIDKIVDSKIGFKEASLFKSMIYGNDLDLSEEISNNFKENGISHMLAISGLHMMYVIKLLNVISKDMNLKIKKFLYLSFILIFCIISSMSMSVIRAAIMSTITILEGKNKEDKFFLLSYKKLLISFVVLICYNPYNIFNVGFQMSFLATFGIITYKSIIESFFLVKLKISKRYIYIIEILSISLSSSIVIFPLQIYYFGRFELISFISNILLSLVISFEFFLGFISLFFCFVPFVSDILFTSNYVILKIIINLTCYISKINYFTIFIPRFNYLELFFIYTSLILNTFKKYIPALFNKKIKTIIRKIICIVTIISFLYIISMYIYRKYFEEFIYFFNVEQGNMAVIRSKRKIIVIDIGSTTKGVSSRILKSFLEAKAITNIDVICITHMHEDHVNGIYEVSKNFNIKSVVYSEPFTTQKGEYEKVNSLLELKKIPKIQIKKGDVINIGGVKIDVLMPLDDEIIISKDMLNSNSCIYLLSKNSNNYLFMGDSTIETENKLVKSISKKEEEKLKNLTAIQIGHHGSKTSSSELFIKSINPCVAVISSKKEKFNHPNKEVIDILQKYKFNIKVTEKCGAIKLK